MLFLISHGITTQFLYGVALGMTIGGITRLFEWFVT